MQTEVRGVINCCSGVATPFRDVIEYFIRDRKLTIKPDYGAFPDRPYDSPAIWGDPAPIDRILAAGPAELATNCFQFIDISLDSAII